MIRGDQVDDVENKQQLVYRKTINKIEMNYVLVNKICKQNNLFDMVQFLLLFFILVLTILIFYYFIDHLIKFVVKFLRFIEFFE